MNVQKNKFKQLKTNHLFIISCSSVLIVLNCAHGAPGARWGSKGGLLTGLTKNQYERCVVCCKNNMVSNEVKLASRNGTYVKSCAWRG